MAAKGDAMKATDIKERPILFSGPMIRAILRDENPKTQTRRVAMDLPSHPAIARWVCDSNGWWEPVPHSEQVREQYITTWPAGFYRCKYGKPGDRLWVKEKHVLLDRDGWSDPARPRDAMISGRRNGVGYADFEHDPDSERCRKELGYKWRPSIHMPRWASRITLEITEVRVQRLQDISEADARAEGFDAATCAQFFLRAAGKHAPLDRMWFEDADGGSADSDDYCYRCAKKLLPKNCVLRGDGGTASETDGPAFCQHCGEPLLVSLTSYGIDRELFLDDPDDNRSHYACSGTDAAIAAQFSGGIGDLRDHHLGRLAQVGFAAAWDVLNDEYGRRWASNPWVWALTFKRLEQP